MANENYLEKVDRDFDDYIEHLTNQGYWKKESGKRYLDSKYIVEYAIVVSKALGKNRNANKRTQIRKYYDYCLKIKNQLDKKSFHEKEAEVVKLLPAVNYAMSRKKVTKEFQQFLKKNLDYILKEGHSEKEKKECYLAFVKHFEAIIAYTKE